MYIPYISEVTSINFAIESVVERKKSCCQVKKSKSPFYRDDVAVLSSLNGSYTPEGAGGGICPDQTD